MLSSITSSRRAVSRSRLRIIALPGTPCAGCGTLQSTPWVGSSNRLPKSDPSSFFFFFFSWTHAELPLLGSVGPDIPFAPNYNSVPGQISEDFFSRVDLPRGHFDGRMTFPWGLNDTVKSVGSMKHSWSKKVMADTISAYVRGSTFLPAIPPNPVATVTWFQVWDSAGKGPSLFFCGFAASVLNVRACVLQRSILCNTLSNLTMAPKCKRSGYRSPTSRSSSTSSPPQRPSPSLSHTRTRNSPSPCADPGLNMSTTT